MSEPAAPDRRSAHFLSLLPWTARDLEPVLARAQHGPGDTLRGRTVLFWSDAPREQLEREDLWQGAREAGAEVLQTPRPAVAGVPPNGDAAAVWVVEPAHGRALRPLVRRATRPVLLLRSDSNDPLRALQDYAALRRRPGRADLRAHWRGPASPRLHGWIELATKFPVTLDVDLTGGEAPDAALTEFARARAKGTFRLPGERDAAAVAEVLLWRHDPGGRVLPGAIWVPLAGAPPWPPAWDRACAAALMEELVRRWEGMPSGRESL